MKYIEKNKKGMTLVETITSLAILSIIILLVFTLIMITIRKQSYYGNKMRTYVYLNSAINFIENQLDISIKDISVDNKRLILQSEKNTLIEIGLKNNLLVTNKTVKTPRFKLDNIEFEKSGALLYVTIEVWGEKLTRCLELKSKDIKKEIFQ